MLTGDGIVAAIDAAYASEPRDTSRSYIGASIIGNGCDAYLAFCMRGFPENQIEPRTKRIFALGHKLEKMVLKDLRKAGLSVFEVDGLTGKQFAMQKYGGHFKAHMDGQVIDGDEVLGLEIKSMNAAKFKTFKEYGVSTSHPQYYFQMQAMMWAGRFSRFVFVAYCKDNSEYHAQIIEYDDIEGYAIEARIENVMANRGAKVAKDRTDWRCKMCFKSDACWGDLPPLKECKTCGHAEARVSGGWQCNKHSKDALAVCSDWVKYIPKDKV